MSVAHLPGAQHVPVLIGCEESGTVRDAFPVRDTEFAALTVDWNRVSDGARPHAVLRPATSPHHA